MQSPYLTVALLAFLAAGCLIAGTAQADPTEALKVCARLADKDARFACYDELGQRVLAEDGKATPSLPDDIGGAEFEKQAHGQIKEDRGQVTSCQKGGDGRWYFYFDNGQVWKEANTGRNRFRNCDFLASVYRDGFGYKMRIEESGKRIRVTRLR